MSTSTANAVRVQQPKCLNDFALLPTSRHKLESILDGTLSFPDNGVNGIILYGLHGTGKTTMANLFPGLVETAKTTAAAQHTPPGDIIDSVGPLISYHPCVQGQNGVVLINTSKTLQASFPLTQVVFTTSFWMKQICSLTQPWHRSNP